MATSVRFSVRAFKIQNSFTSKSFPLKIPLIALCMAFASQVIGQPQFTLSITTDIEVADNRSHIWEIYRIKNNADTVLVKTDIGPFTSIRIANSRHLGPYLFRLRDSSCTWDKNSRSFYYSGPILKEYVYFTTKEDYQKKHIRFGPPIAPIKTRKQLRKEGREDRKVRPKRLPSLEHGAVYDA